MEAKDSKVGSYAWQSILQGRDVIQRGSRWRVGDGREIKIWQHHWLPIKHPTVVASPIIETMEDATVDMLIDPLTRQWDESLIDGIFIPHEAEKIKKIPLARVRVEDVLFWLFSRDGNYNCKSGYRFLKEKGNSVMTEEFASQDKVVWTGVWLLDSPSEVKNQIWRACKNSTPTKADLVRRTLMLTLCVIGVRQLLKQHYMRCGSVRS